MDVRQVIIEPVVSEKSYALMADGKYTFRVDGADFTPDARARGRRRSSSWRPAIGSSCSRGPQLRSSTDQSTTAIVGFIALCPMNPTTSGCGT